MKKNKGPNESVRSTQKPMQNNDSGKAVGSVT